MAQPAEPHDAYELGRHDERERMAQRCANRLGVPEYEWDSAESTAFAAGVEEGEADERERIIARLAAAAEQFDASGLPRPARWCQSMIETLTSERRDSRAAAMTRWGLADTDAPARQTPAIPDGTAPQPADFWHACAEQVAQAERDGNTALAAELAPPGSHTAAVIRLILACRRAG